ncbi:hypothetical protein M5689_006269 [Euphorbia peplus]|nr:hypothetical protein M5689_006269 [Euphorbia peplus]
MMKCNSVLAFIVLALFIISSFGNGVKMGEAAKICTNVVGGYCHPISCRSACEHRYGKAATSFCIFLSCACNYPC